MKKSILIVLVFFLFVGFNAFGQQADSLIFVRQQWVSNKLANGLVWKQTHFDSLFSSRQEINVVEIDLKKFKKRIKLSGLSEGLLTTSDFAQNSHAHIAINGGFFNMKAGGAVDFIKINNRIVNKTVAENMRANAIFAFDGRHFEIVDAIDSASYYSKYPNVLLSGPLLVHQKQTIDLDSNAFNNNRHPRSAIAIKGNKLILVTVDGRNSQAQGMSLPELRSVFYWYGVNEAMNLDGGGSTTLYVRDATPNGVVNHPSDNKLFDHEGERKVANVILVL